MKTIARRQRRHPRISEGVFVRTCVHTVAPGWSFFCGQDVHKCPWNFWDFYALGSGLSSLGSSFVSFACTSGARAGTKRPKYCGLALIYTTAIIFSSLAPLSFSRRGYSLFSGPFSWILAHPLLAAALKRFLPRRCRILTLSATFQRHIRLEKVIYASRRASRLLSNPQYFPPFRMAGWCRLAQCAIN